MRRTAVQLAALLATTTANSLVDLKESWMADLMVSMMAVRLGVWLECLLVAALESLWACKTAV